MQASARRAFLFIHKPSLINHFKTLATLPTTREFLTPPTSQNQIVPTDIVHQISNIVRTDFYIEQSLNNLRLPSISSDLICAVLRVCNTTPLGSFRFFQWACSYAAYSPTAHDFEEIIITLARTHSWKRMWDTINQMSKRHNLGVGPDVVAIIIEAYGKAGYLDMAVDVFNRCNDKLLRCPQTTGIYNSLLFVLCKEKNISAAYALIRRLVRKGGIPDKSTFSVMINALCLGGDTKEAEDFLQEMNMLGFPPPVHGWDLILLGILNGGYVEAAHQMARKMMANCMLPQIETLSCLLEILLKLGDIDVSADLFCTALRLGFCANMRMYKVLILAVLNTGRVDDALMLLRRSINGGFKPLPSLYGPIMECLCKKGRFDEAFGFFSHMKVKGHPPNRAVYTMLITLSSYGGRFMEAANLLVEMVESNMTPMSHCFDMVSGGLQNCGDYELAKKIKSLQASGAMQ